MRWPNSKPVPCVLLAMLLWLGAAGRTKADAYYTVTDLGNNQEILGYPQTIKNLATGVSYAFPNVAPQLPVADLTNLPGVTLASDGSNSTFYPMIVKDSNSAGTALGFVPTGLNQTDLYSSVNMGYAVRSPNGQWSSFVAVSQNTEGPLPIVMLSHQANVVVAYLAQGATLINPVDGSSTPIAQLVPQSFLAQFGSTFSPSRVDDLGDIIGIAMASDGTTHAVLLSPPGVDPLIPPSAIPEPSTQALLLWGAGGLAARWGLRKSQRRA